MPMVVSVDPLQQSVSSFKCILKCSICIHMIILKSFTIVNHVVELIKASIDDFFSLVVRYVFSCLQARR